MQQTINKTTGVTIGDLEDCLSRMNDLIVANDVLSDQEIKTLKEKTTELKNAINHIEVDASEVGFIASIQNLFGCGPIPEIRRNTKASTIAISHLESLNERMLVISANYSEMKTHVKFLSQHMKDLLNTNKMMLSEMQDMKKNMHKMQQDAKARDDEMKKLLTTLVQKDQGRSR